MSDLDTGANAASGTRANPTTPPAPTMQDAWDEVAQYVTNAGVMAEMHRKDAAYHTRLGNHQEAKRKLALAAFHDRREAILTRVCNLIDLAIGDPETMQRLKDRAADKRAAEVAARSDAAAEQGEGSE